ncbi:hypothetical protein BJ980_003166 [Nocardioides daedukensis]|uniref:Uncharacterized protein n=1 Tax=Nocardioides daedukensis TaxID=634462 RepID=A0A7Y9S591_9ACTN|nr:permease prefix domain 1-containing protein [Nocardioides daedukensis]NYG60243.1 hypothetical protein [Nocardioides daedukensis]
MATTLTEKYVHAVTRSLPEDQRLDVADELRATIADRVDSLVRDEQRSPDEAEHAAIAELDDPDRLAAEYTGRSLHLIGPASYPSYIRLMKALMTTIVPIVAVVVLVTAILTDRPFGAVVGHTAWTTFNVVVHLFFWVTLIWVLAERGSGPDQVEERLTAKWTPDDLPEPPRQTHFALPDVAFSIVALTAMGAWIVGQHFLSWVHDTADEPVPTLDPGLWSGWLPLLLLVLALSIGFEFAKFRTGHWTRPLLVVNAALGLALTAPLVVLAATDQLLNPAIFDELARAGTEVDPGHVNTIVIISALVILVWDLVASVRSAALIERESHDTAAV